MAGQVCTHRVITCSLFLFIQRHLKNLKHLRGNSQHKITGKKEKGKKKQQKISRQSVSEALQTEPAAGRGGRKSTVKDKTVMSITAGHEKQSGRKRWKHQSRDSLGLAVFSNRAPALLFTTHGYSCSLKTVFCWTSSRWAVGNHLVYVCIHRCWTQQGAKQRQEGWVIAKYRNL